MAKWEDFIYIVLHFTKDFPEYRNLAIVHTNTCDRNHNLNG